MAFQTPASRKTFVHHHAKLHLKMCGYFLFVLCAAVTANSVHAQDYLCPQKIAYVENEPMSQKAIVILQKVYADLGCPLQAVKLPGRRGPLHFNEGLVDGELLRAIPAEKNYARAFVRSSVPLREISNRLWRNPNDDDPQTPIAFTLGVAWQEKFAKTNTDKTGVANKPMMFNTELYEAYANGRITRFLAADTNIDDMIAKGILGSTPAPVIEETVSVLPLYHYLGAEYAPFMTKFSELVAKTDPFRSPQAE
ncbi:hypothetical protein [Thalassospira sp.]|uniref:hypothetical protein n=1 Tax=Thalassospira sp. TaxID=1912094 RepID=UPI000C45B7A6|nr:hypothetical protein [Thalassospira sp.]MBC07288.1 hypothetical protein [Thalassospira sp.]|tara:strand:+ start:3815 stop:4570 length:756 start_codon:yes stop_codon:yes gene_type:complete